MSEAAAAAFGDNQDVQLPFDELLARWVLDDLAPEDVPDLAVAALANGCETGEVAVLAGLTRPTRREIENELTPLLQRLCITRPTKYAALKVVVDACATTIADGTVEPSRGAHRLCLWANEVFDEGDLFDQVAIFVGLASEWDDDENHRAEYERQMVEEAATLISNGGLQLGSRT